MLGCTVVDFKTDAVYIHVCMYVCMYRYLEERRKKILARRKGLTAEEEQIVEFSDLKGLSEIPSTCTLVNVNHFQLEYSFTV